MEVASSWPLNVDLGRFPPVECSIGYGSGVIRQQGYEQSKRPMVDLVFVVRENALKDWHTENLKAHPAHYSGLARALGPKTVCHLQRWGPGLYYMPHVQLPTTEGGVLDAKYGVITTEALQEDLLNWSSLYIAGRMQKPIVLEWYSKDREAQDTLCQAVVKNRRAALSAALLCSGGCSLGLSSLLSSIVQLSYEGDVRVGVAEDPRKVRNIVEAQHDALWSIYKPLAATLNADISGAELSSVSVRFDNSSAGRRRLFGELPPAIQQSVTASAQGQEPWMDSQALRGTLRTVVRRSSLQQAAKGLLSSGISRSLRYAVQKVAKRLK
eukprot:TRINITY_DN31848_c0_g1_i1.p1 TRINITY_DN31848_c0_g1~~TRINITY_DN31848_c0_g1_i1.p1  ORF type:complete len:325 (+),score=73.40 TRINITY_DN31848_c0_g1_i1:39-1013(+)